MAKDVCIDRPRYYGLFWRWHFFAALIVIPFVLWQSTTGTLYLWSEAWMDYAHPALRFVAQSPHDVAPSVQIAAALATVAHAPGSNAPMPMAGMNMGTAAMPSGMAMDMNMPRVSSGPPVVGLLMPEDRSRSTTVLMASPGGLSYPVFVDPHTARVLGSLMPSQWPPGWSRSLHGGWPIGKPGSWLLELGDCWAIVMILTGFYLWWPRNRPFPEILWPRFHRGARIALRDLHSSVAVLFSAIFLFFLISALPWTSFWGGEVLSRVEAAIGQASPAAFSTGGASVGQVSQSLPALDQAVREARSRGVRGTLDIRLSPWNQAGWWLTNVHTLASDHTIQTAPGNGKIVSDVTNAELPAIPRFVALGIHVHQGDFGPLNLLLNTAFALSLVWLTVTGAASWWLRRPHGRLAAPPRTLTPWPRTLWIGAALMCAVLPIFGLSVLVVSAGNRVLRLAVVKPY
ncbi:MAG TPA: PepSY domain-containing protein [Rhizomicrobium sp.]|jgi:uncharacterized iron-regulated membrane protein